MNTLSKICTVFMLVGATSLFAAEGETGTAATTTPSGGRPGPRMQGRGGHHGPGGGNFSFMICPNCHHRLIVLAPGGHGGHGGRDGRDGRDMRDGKGGGRRFRGPEGKGGGFRGPRGGEGKGKTASQTTEGTK